MKVSLAALAIYLFIATANVQADSESSWATDIVGTWIEVVGEDDSIRGIATYFADGRYHSYGYYPTDETYYYGDGRWEIDGDLSCIRVYFESTKRFERGQLLCSRIIQIDDEVFTFETPWRERITMVRLARGMIDEKTAALLDDSAKASEQEEN